MENKLIDLTNIKGAIFDVDGTMLDSMKLWQDVEANYLRSLGKEPNPDFIDVMRVYSHDEAADYFRDAYGIAKTNREITDEKNKLMEEGYAVLCTIKSGVIKTLETLKENNIRMCVATATDKYLVEIGLKRFGIDKYFEKIFTCGEENTTKGRPDIFLNAAKFLGTIPTQTLVFEDALHAIESAKSAGFVVVAVSDLAQEDNLEVIRTAGDYYFDSMGDIFHTSLSASK